MISIAGFSNCPAITPDHFVIRALLVLAREEDHIFDLDSIFLVSKRSRHR